jgi:phosphate-selective porin OprO/OprP
VARRRGRPVCFAALVAALFLPASAARAQSSDRPRFQWNDRPELRAGIFRVAFRARVQADVRRSTAPFPSLDDQTLDLARRRVGVEGRVANALDFQVEYEIGDDTDPWRDVYVNLRQFDAVQVRAGKFKLPFSLDENTSAANLDFAYRSLAASALAPGRDVGVMVHGRLFGGLFRYELGTFRHDGNNTRPRAASTRVFGGRTLAWRLGVQPFDGRSTPLADLLLSAAWADSELEEGFSSVRGETVFGADFYDSDYWVLGPRRRSSLEARWRPGPFSVKSEVIRVTESRIGLSVEDTDLSPLRATGWYVSGTWAVTGEEKADGLDAPRRPFLQGGPGAIEVAVRIERLAFDSTATGEVPSTSPRADVIVGNRNRVTTIGANWYWNPWVKIQFNLIRESLADPAQGPLPSQPAFWSRVVRFQFSL